MDLHSILIAILMVMGILLLLALTVLAVLLIIALLWMIRTGKALADARAKFKGWVLRRK